MRRVLGIALSALVMLAAIDTASAQSKMRGSMYEQGSAWSGGYIGGHVGGGWGTVSGGGDEADISGLVGGAHLGYNFQRDRLLFGIEVDLDASGVEKSWSIAGVSVSVGPSWLASIRGRLGLVHDNLLLYGTLGVAWAEYEIGATVAGISASVGDSLTGFVVGGGIEYKFSENFSARLEALHYTFDDQTLTAGGTSVRFDTDLTVVRGGLTWHLM
jgi:outer membrane immunogenic protein